VSTPAASAAAGFARRAAARYSPAMRKTIIGLLLVGAALGVVVLSSCAAGGDAALTELKVKAALLEKLGTDALGIKVAVVGDKVTLTGAVSKRSTEELAEEVARSVEGVKKVDNRLEVVESAQSSGNVENEASDSLLESKVKMALASEIGRHAWKVEVEATDGVVSLRGTVPDRQRHEIAVKTAKETKGVRKVVDLLKTAD
jgi:osmotically-inducible protein OsmY